MESIYHCRIRSRCRNLYKDLYDNYLKDSPACDCGTNVEDAEHYFFRRDLYTIERIRFFHLSRRFYPLGVQFLLYGSDQLTEEDNITVFSHVHEYIKETIRFS